MAKKCIEVFFDILNKINKKTFSFVFFAAIFSLLVSFVPFHSAEEVASNAQAFSFQSAEERTLFAQAPPGPPPCVPHCGGCACCFCNPCVCNCACPGPTAQMDAVGYLENRDCHKNINCQCCSCSATCIWGCWYDMEWCGDGIRNDTEDCDGYNPAPAQCLTNLSGNFPNDSMANSVSYDGRILCDTCSWRYTDIDGGPLDSQLCSANTACAKGEAQCNCSPVDGRTCTWQATCAPIDWCGDGKINGPELYCDIHQASGTVDFGGETCQSKICGDIDPTDTEDKSLHSKNPACLAEMAAYGGNLTCVNTCRHIYTVPACDFPLDATGIDLSGDGLSVLVTDSSLWSLQMFAIANPTKVVAIHYFDTEPLSIDVVGNYAYVGTKGEFAIVNLDQLNKPDAFPDPGAPYVFPPFRPKNPPLPFLEEQPLPIASIPVLGHVNDVHIDGNYAYLAIGTAGAVGPAALQIINIVNPAAPVSVGSFSYPPTMTGFQSVDVSGNYAYASYADGNNGVGYFVQFNVIVKTLPFPIKLINIGTTSSSISISGNYAFIDGFSTQSSVDISVPGNPLTVLAVDNINTGFETFAFDIFGNKSYVSVKGVGLRAVDITDPKDVLLGETFVVPNDIVNEIMVDIVIDAAGIFAYAAAGEAGFRIIDLSAVCGDGVLNGHEICDGSDLGGETCVTQGFAEGVLSCNPLCTAFDTRACVACGPVDGICPDGCTNPPDPDCPTCVGVVCPPPGFCEIGPGVCKNVNNSAVCVYSDDPNACNAPGFCQVMPGRCEKSDSSCRYSDDPSFCDAGDGDICTGDRCVSTDGGLTSNCVAGSDICSGIVPCERMVNNPATPWDDTRSCEFCHGVMLLNQGMNFLMKIASVTAVLVIIITGFLFITSAGNPERKNNAKTALKWVIVGFLILSLSWLIVDFLLSAWGYLDPLGGKWNVVCD